MKKNFLTCLLLLCVYLSVHGQTMAPAIQYVAAKNGLIIREEATQNAKALGKIPYGEKIEVKEAGNSHAITIEGFEGKWVKATYNNVSGYIVDCFLLPVPPPSTGIASLEAYLDQVSTLAAPAVVVNYAAEDPEALTKRLYTNGAEQHIHSVNEYASTLTFLPYFTIQQAYLLMRLLQEYPEYIAPDALFPRNSKKTKGTYGDVIVTVKKAGNEPGAAVTSIDIVYTGEAMSSYTLRFYYVDSGQAVIFFDEAL